MPQHIAILSLPFLKYNIVSAPSLTSSFKKHTKSLLQCPNPIYAFNRTGPRYDESHLDYYGLMDMGELSECTITTTQFTLLPWAPAKGQSALENNIKTFISDGQPIN